MNRFAVIEEVIEKSAKKFSQLDDKTWNDYPEPLKTPYRVLGRQVACVLAPLIAEDLRAKQLEEALDGIVKFLDSLSVETILEAVKESA
jgi:hypothetical protein